jgi:hypothetical protein
MSSIPQNVAERLALTSRQSRVNSLRREVQSHTLRGGEMTAAERVDSSSRACAVQQVALRRLLAAIDQCDLASAEEHLQTALSAAAWAKGIAHARATAVSAA